MKLRCCRVCGWSTYSLTLHKFYFKWNIISIEEPVCPICFRWAEKCGAKTIHNEDLACRWAEKCGAKSILKEDLACANHGQTS